MTREESTMGSPREYPPIRKCECGICDQRFNGDSAVEVARSLARHWNDEHGDELRYSETPYKTERYGGEHLHGDEYAYTVKDYYITVYDVLNPEGETPFKYEYAKKLEAEDVCEDCWRPVRAVDGYREVSDDGWRTKYRCDECHQRRQIDRRKAENHSVGEFA